MAQLAELNIANKTYTVIKTFFGTEKIMENDQVLSKKWSITGAKHQCEINGEDYIFHTILPTMHNDQNYLFLYQNNQIVQNIKIGSRPFHRKRFFMGFVIGILVYYFYQL